MGLSYLFCFAGRFSGCFGGGCFGGGGGFGGGFRGGFGPRSFARCRGCAGFGVFFHGIVQRLSILL